jgi:hypothetical protein
VPRHFCAFAVCSLLLQDGLVSPKELQAPLHPVQVTTSAANSLSFLLFVLLQGFGAPEGAAGSSARIPLQVCVSVKLFPYLSR